MANTHKEPMVRMTIDMKPEMHEALRARCEELDLTGSQLVRRMIREDLERAVAEKNAQHSA